MFNFAKSLKDSLARTRESVFGQIMTVIGQSDLTEDTFDQLEAMLIQADLGMVLADEITADLELKAGEQGIIRSEVLRHELRKELRQRLKDNPPLNLTGQPTVILMVGVNGSGKTTTTAKLARHLLNQKKSVMLAAGDTFRAAAVEQLQIWGQRLNVPVIAGQANADPGAVAHDAVNAAKARGVDVLIVDTAGRLQNKFNLMEELRKVRAVIAKALPGAPHETLLVLDATTGQNALSQAHAFKEAVAISGVMLAKLDGSAKGGMAFAIGHELDLPIRLVGTGEKVDDLAVFDADKFLEGLLDA
jgi:fused signal recognition particle receptor